MYFVYQKQINVASEQNYDVDSIVEWFQNYIDGDYPNYVIDWLDTNLEDFVEEFLDLLDPMLNIDGEIDDNNIAELLDNEEFMTEFRQYLCD